MTEFKLLSWNVNGIRAVVRKGFFDWLYQHTPDILCLQETKAHSNQLDENLLNPTDYYTYWENPERKGYSGVALFSKEKPLSIETDFGKNVIDTEGRVLIAIYQSFILLNIYFPNGKQNEARQHYKLDFYNIFLNYVDTLRESGKSIIICGDVNTAHTEIDLARPKENAKVSGFKPEERAWIDTFLEHGFTDTFRQFNSEPGQYTWWDVKSGARERNIGWRIDYFFISKNLVPSITSAFIMEEVMGSDHCPIGITIKLDK